jgi:hypothetical protein
MNSGDGAEFQFIVFLNTDGVRDRQNQRAARSYAGKRGHQKRRTRLVQDMNHFKISTPQDMTTAVAGSSTRQGRLANPTTDIDVNRLDPFDTLAVDALRLQELLRHRT